ncbi:MAG: lipopolysaccharide transport periplasmic protein LptA [Gammaproteobacteria bacterium HGW-Gammaproteobacteria-3]|jgi:lipopolysaccharide export system protein LptA|nr:MAG: lipopolysaccharide transport periplasmic protein LptA [Gammaproteobacteria bacterium HGW-Gammaproteobacteria-3]
MRQNKNKWAGAGLLLFALYSANSHALKSDSDQPVIIDSNAASYDDTTATSIYTGNVVATQGSLEVKCDRLEVYFKDGEVDKFIAIGKPARFRQMPDKGAEIRGRALKGEYYPEQSLLILIKEAVVEQDGNTYASELIRYDSKNAVVKAGEQSSDTKRVRVILKPKSAK